MKIIVTGSLGNVSKPLTGILAGGGHDVTVVSSDPKKKDAITALGAKAAIGSMKDAAFLARTFAGAAAVYAMIPMSFTEADQEAYMRDIAGNYVHAAGSAGVKRLVVLSGWAADLTTGFNVEGMFESLAGVSVSILRPAYFYSNFYFSMDMIRGKGLMGKFLTLRYSGPGALLAGRTGLLMGNFGGDDRIVLVSPKDIAEAAAEELLSTGPGQVRYVGSEEMTCNEAARIIGAAVGRPWLKWVLLSDKQMLQGLKMAKMPNSVAKAMVEMQAAMHSGKTLENFHRNNPKMGKVTLADFAREFAAVYNAKQA